MHKEDAKHIAKVPRVGMASNKIKYLDQTLRIFAWIILKISHLIHNPRWIQIPTLSSTLRPFQ